jgi:hypothetical protein
MVLFSERYGYKPVRESLQFECMDDELRTALWNLLCQSRISAGKQHYNITYYDSDVESFYINLWKNFWNKPLDELYDYFTHPYEELRKFFFGCEWCEVYDLLEFFAENFPHYSTNWFIKSTNEVLESEKSAYRFVDFEITPITSETEIEAVENALEDSPDPIQIHLKEALKLLSDKKSPDYRNSIKESISAVESICKLITKNPKSTLGKCLTKIEKKVELHPALKEAFRKLYGYTNDSDGIRHALLKEPNLDYEDATFMLVSCSTFVNYLLTKVEKAGIDINRKQEEFPELFEALKLTLENNGVDFETIITDFGQVDAAEKRENSYEFSINEHLKAFIYAMLSNRRRWVDIVDKLPQIDSIFFNFDPDTLGSCDTEDLLNEIKKIKVGNISINKQIKNLPHNIQQFKKIEKDFGSLDTFVTHDSPSKVVKRLSKSTSKYKIKQMGDALALEYLKSVGIKGMKPDVHIKRICGPQRLDIIRSKDTKKQLEEFKQFAEAVDVSETYLDNLIWIFGADGFGKICTNNPQCDKCELIKYCNYKN